MIPPGIVIVRQKQILDVGEGLTVPLGNRLPTDDPLREIAEFHIEEGGLEVIQKAGKAVAVILPRLRSSPL